jgi:hypothetical protein
VACPLDELQDADPQWGVERLRLFGAAGGGVFSILVVIALALAPGPSSADGATVGKYYSAHGTETLWQASLIGFALIFFIWFVGVFATGTSSGRVVLVSASVTAALYLVAFGAWESLGEIYSRANGSDLDDGDAHVLYDVGVGATHLANFTVAAFVGGTAFAVLARRQPGRLLGVLGIALCAVLLVNAPFQIAETSHWSDVVGFAVFIAFLLWVFVLSVSLVLLLRRGGGAAPAADG